MPDLIVGHEMSPITIQADGGYPPYRFTISGGSLPAGLTLDANTGVISGTPTEVNEDAVPYFEVQVTDDIGESDAARFWLTIKPDPRPVAKSGNYTIRPNTKLDILYFDLFTGGGFDNFEITSTYGGTVTRKIDRLTFAPLSDFVGTATFTYYVTKDDLVSDVATITIEVREPAQFTFTPATGALPSAIAGEPYQQAVTASGGVAPLTYSIKSGALPSGMILNINTGVITGPADADSVGDYSFTVGVRDANGAIGEANYTLKVTEAAISVADRVVEVPAGQQPANVDLTAGATGGPFTGADVVAVEPAHAGRAEIVGDQYAASGPVSPTGFYLKFIPNPGYSGSVKVTYTLHSAHAGSSSGTVTYKLAADAAWIAEEIDGKVRGFVQTRMGMLSSTIKVPGLMERRRMSRAATPVTTTSVSPSADGLTMGLSTSLAQVEAAETNGEAASDRSFNVWLDTAFLAHNREENGGKWGNFGMVSAGADYLVSEKILVGVSAHFDRMTDPTDEDAEITGSGWMAGPYASLEIGNGVFWDTSLLAGGSSNDIDTALWDGSFDTSRVMFDTSLKGQWEIGNGIVLTPALRAVYFREKVKDYSASDGTGTIAIGGHSQEQLRVSAGADLEKTFRLANGKDLGTRIGVTAGFAGMDGTGAYAQAKAGLAYEFVEGLFVEGDVLYTYATGGDQSVGAKIGVRYAW